MRTIAALAGHKITCNVHPYPTIGQEQCMQVEMDKAEETAASTAKQKVATEARRATAAAAKAAAPTAVRKGNSSGRGSAHWKGWGGWGGGREGRDGTQAKGGKSSAESEEAPSSQKRRQTVEPYVWYTGAESSPGVMMREKRDEKE